MKHIYLLLGTLLSFISLTYAQPGSLDQTFGDGGKVVTDFFGGNDRGFSTILQSDGKILVAGYAYNGANNDFAIVRYKTDGSVDSSFGVNGKVLTDFGNTDDRIGQILIQNNGKIIVSGQVDYQFAAARYNVDGSLDNSFGVGGKVITTYPAGKVCAALENDGKMVSASFEFYPGESGESVGLIRFNDNGTLDNTFGTNGLTTTKFTETNNTAYGIVTQNDGKIVIAGTTGSEAFLVLARYNYDGSLDNTFGDNGKIISHAIGSIQVFGVSIALLKSKEFIVSVMPSSIADPIDKFGLVKFKNTGVVDSAFGNNGTVIKSIRGESDQPIALAIQEDDKIVQVGYSAKNSKYDFATLRYNSDGTIDNNFGDTGVVITSFGNITSFGESVAIQQDGKIIVAGVTIDGTNNNFALARYNVTDVLPITLSSFTATKKQTSVLLNWQTASETNNNYFAIERSNNSSNGFKEIARVNSKGNSSQSQQYNFEDITPLNGFNYYRLKQVNKDGSSTTSKIVLIDFTKDAIIALYPNPVKDIMNIKGLSGTTTLSVIDAGGKLLATTKTTNNTYNWNIRALPSGNYYLRIEANKKITTIKFIKQ